MAARGEPEFPVKGSLARATSSPMTFSSPVLAPRIVLAAPQGRSGKTTVSLGLCAALAARGLAVQPFKKGPDYIDPSWLSTAAGRLCRSLDPFFHAAHERLRSEFLKGAREADICLIEGNHGLYDSSLPELPDGAAVIEEGQTPFHTDPLGGGSTAAVARALQAPVLLVVNTARMTRSTAAMVHGYQTFEPETPIAGVILNNVAHSRHEARLRQAVESSCGIPVVGALPRRENLTIPDRHLGLVPRDEDEGLLPVLEACRQAAEQYLDLNQILAIARQAPRLSAGETAPPRAGHAAAVTIGVIRDRAFSFYYPENLEALEDAGAHLVFIDSMHTPHLPGISALYIGGGFPEMFMDELAANRTLMQDVRNAVESGLPVYAECGGMMYLARKLHWKGRTTSMVGVLPFDVEMTTRPQGHGYILAQVAADNPFLPQGTLVRGHEFHQSRLVDFDPGIPAAYNLLKGKGLGAAKDGLMAHNVLAGYTHLHAAGAPDWAPGLVQRARAFANGQAAFSATLPGEVER